MNILRLTRKILLVAALLAFTALGLFSTFGTPGKVAPPLSNPIAVARLTAPSSTLPQVAGSQGVGDCGTAGDFAAAASDNAQSLSTLSVTPYGVSEVGWASYAPLVAREIGARCGPETTGFAAQLALWQLAHALPSGGRMDAATLAKMSTLWLLRRPFVLASQKGCPPSPDAATLARADPAEAYGGKKILARQGALDAYRRMAAAARRDLGEGVAQLRIASAYRGPIEEAFRCALGGCGTAGKARCSAHRTGLAFDFYLGAAPGLDAFSTQPANRLYLSGGPTYRWLVANADRFGFVNYPYEPWHWEWTGEAI